MTFNVGDKVTHDCFGDGEIAFGPYKTRFFGEAYLISDGDGVHFAVRAPSLTPRPSFAVGDTARTRTGTTVTVTYGPYQPTHDGRPFYVVRFPEGTEGSIMEEDLSPLPAEPTVGDTVRITGETMYGDLPHGTVGTLMGIDSTDEDGVPYKVHSDEHDDYDWTSSVERA